MYASQVREELTGLLHILLADVSFPVTTRSQHSTLLRERTSWPPSWNLDVRSKIWFGQSMRICAKNIRDKFHPDLCWLKRRSLRLFFKMSPQQEEEEQDE